MKKENMGEGTYLDFLTLFRVLRFSINNNIKPEILTVHS